MKCNQCSIYSSLDPCGPYVIKGADSMKRKSGNCIICSINVVITKPKGKSQTNNTHHRFGEYLKWIEENTDNSYRALYGETTFVFGFESPSDAILFKTRWIND